ncbi:MAG: SCP2 sterol-binding domain-containing protein [Pseudomonadota bacterium]
MSLLDKVNSALEGKSFPGSVRVEVTDSFTTAVDSSGSFLSENEDCDCTLQIDEETLQGIIDGSTDAMGAYFSGSLKIKGDMGVAMALAEILKQ